MINYALGKFFIFSGHFPFRIAIPKGVLFTTVAQPPTTGRNFFLFQTGDALPCC